MPAERLQQPETVRPRAELFSPAVTHLRHVASMAPVVMLAAEFLALCATPTGPARSVWQLALLLVVIAMLALAAPRRSRRFKDHPAVPTTDLRNLTPHPVTLLNTDEVAVTIAPAGQIPRVELTRYEVDAISTRHGRIRMTETLLGSQVDGLPDPVDGVLLIVSRLAMEAVPERVDLVFPDDLIRDDTGAVIGARALGRLRHGQHPTG